MTKAFIDYLPHGIDPKKFYPLSIEDQGKDIEIDTPNGKSIFTQYDLSRELRRKFFGGEEPDFVVLFVSRNMNRKMIANVCLSFDSFVKMLPKEKADRCILVMHTEPVSEAGTDIKAVVDQLFYESRIVFSFARTDYRDLIQLYNAADVTISISYNEGWGLSITESLMCGTPVLVNVTGGIQDQMRFYDETGKWIEFDSKFTSNHNARYKNHGIGDKKWGLVVFPNNRSLAGAPPTPYISEDRCDYMEVAHRLMDFYNMTPDERKAMGLNGREWLLSEESSMNAPAMCKNFMKSVDYVLDNFEPPPAYEIIKIKRLPKFNNPVLSQYVP